MVETDSKQTQKAKWLETHTLTQEQFNKLVLEKIVRATRWHEAVRKREGLLEHR
jgi:hypothetical protein